jgi:hypothetical protein
MLRQRNELTILRGMEIIDPKKPARWTHMTVRIELPDTPEGDYARLHADMHEAGFSRIITSGEGRSFHLPHATYNKRVRGMSYKEARDAAVVIARHSHPEPRVLVIAGPRAWSGLKPVTAANPDPDA